jgi:hypothetical protein
MGEGLVQMPETGPRFSLSSRGPTTHLLIGTGRAIVNVLTSLQLTNDLLSSSQILYFIFKLNDIEV